MTAEKRRKFSISEPELLVERTEALNGQWVTSGQVRYDVRRGDDYLAGNFSFPFKDAKSRDDAIGQASEQLELVLNALADFIHESASARGSNADDADSTHEKSGRAA